MNDRVKRETIFPACCEISDVYIGVPEIQKIIKTNQYNIICKPLKYVLMRPRKSTVQIHPSYE